MEEQTKGNGIWWVLGIIVLVLIIVFAFRGGSKETGPIKIGVSLPLSGDIASYGGYIKAGADLAAKEINDAGGINGRQIQMIYEDDKCTADGATTITKLVSIDKVDAIIGPLCSSSAGPGVPIAQKAKIPTIIWATAPGLTKTGDYIFRTYIPDTLQGKVGAEFAYNTLGKRRVAMIYVKNDWGQGIQEVFAKRFTELGGTIVHNEGVLENTTDLKTIISKIKEEKPDLMYMPVYPSTGVSGLKQMKALGLSVTVLGGDVWDAKEFTSSPEANGVMFTYGKVNDPSDEFKNRVKTVTGSDSNAFTPVAYDSVKILASVMQQVGTNKQAVRDKLVTLSYTAGVSLPKIEFDSDRDLSTGQVEVKIVRNEKTELYKQ